MAGIDGLDAGDLVTAEQMLSTCSAPVTTRWRSNGWRPLTGRGLTEKRLHRGDPAGQPFKVFHDDISDVPDRGGAPTGER